MTSDTFVVDENNLKRYKNKSYTEEEDNSISTTCFALYKSVIISTAIISVVWVALFPVYPNIFQLLYGTSQNLTDQKLNEIIEMMEILVPFFIVFMFGNLLNSVFLTFGKTVFLAVKTVFTQITVYLPYTILYKLGRVYPDEICGRTDEKNSQVCLTATAVLLRQGEAIMMDTVILMFFGWVFLNAKKDLFKGVLY